MLASYLGHFQHASSRRLVYSLWDQWPWLGLLFHYRKGRLIPLWQAVRVSSYRSQVRFFRRLFPNARVVVQRGVKWIALRRGIAVLPETLATN